MKKNSDFVLKMDESVTLAAANRAKALKAQGRDIIDLTLGQPDFPTPKIIGQAAIEAIDNGKASFYTQAGGLPELKNAVQHYWTRFYNYEIQPNEILITAGAKFALYAYFMATVDPDDEVIIPAPYWVSYVDQVKMAGGNPVIVEAKQENNFKVTVEQLEEARTSKSKILLLNSPSNPTGMIYSKEELTAIGEWALAHDLLILADDIYHRLVYNGAEFTAISSLSDEIRKRTTVINGVSKTFAMTGWRIGLIFAARELVAQIIKTHQYLVTSASTQSQFAAIEALKNGADDALPMKKEYLKRRDYIIEKMSDLGFKIIEPDGAFYIFAKIPADLEQDSFKFAVDFAKENAVAIIPGIAFGQYGEGFVRLSYAASMDMIEQAMARLTDYVTKKRG